MKLKMYWALPWLVAGLIGCGGDESATNQVSSQGTPGSRAANSLKPLKVGIVFDSGGIDDKSFNASAWEGIQRAVKELGVVEKHVESKSEKDYEGNLDAMVTEGCDLVVAVGMNMKTATEKVAGDNPNVKFAIVDASVTKENVRSLLFKEEQGSYLAGYAAGLMTKTGKIGFVGGQELDLIKKFYYGYEAGAKDANPKVVILPAKYTGDWNNVETAKVAANTLFSQDADIVYHAAGKAGIGVIKAAEERKLFAIGVDCDQDYIAKGNVLTSMVKRVDQAVFQTIKDLKENKFTSGDVVYDLKAGGVGLSPMTYTKDLVGKENMAKLKAAEEKIVEGKFVVPSNAAEFDKMFPAAK
jgi:basic membrane protein A